MKHQEIRHLAVVKPTPGNHDVNKVRETMPQVRIYFHTCCSDLHQVENEQMDRVVGPILLPLLQTLTLHLSTHLTEQEE